MPEISRQYDPIAREWKSVPVEVPPESVRKHRTRARRPVRRGAPRDLAGLSDGSPIPPWWRYTAFAPQDQLADLRTFIPPPAMRTSRAAVVMPADPGRITVTR